MSEALAERDRMTEEKLVELTPEGEAKQELILIDEKLAKTTDLKTRQKLLNERLKCLMKLMESRKRRPRPSILQEGEKR